MENYSKVFPSVEFLEPLLTAKFAFDSSWSCFERKNPQLAPTNHSLLWFTEQFWCMLTYSYFWREIKPEVMIQTHNKYVLTPKDKLKVQINDWPFIQL